MEIEIKNTQIETIEKVGSRTEYPDEERLKESADFSLKHNTIQERVKSILKMDKYARKDDLFLLLLYYVKCGMIKLIVPLEDFYKINKPESITRAKRKLFEMAKKGNKELNFLLKDEENLEVRKNQEELYRDYYSEKSAMERASANAIWIK